MNTLLVNKVFTIVEQQEFNDAWYASDDLVPQIKYVDFYLNEESCNRALKSLRDFNPNTNFAIMTPDYESFSNNYSMSPIWSYE